MNMRIENSLRQGIRSASCLLSICAGVIFSASVALTQSKQPDEISKLKQLYDQKHYFELRAAVENYNGKAEARLLFFRGAVADIFYRPQISIRYLNQYLAQARDDDWRADAYALLADDFVKIYDYG